MRASITPLTIALIITSGLCSGVIFCCSLFDFIISLTIKKFVFVQPLSCQKSHLFYFTAFGLDFLFRMQYVFIFTINIREVLFLGVIIQIH